MIWDEGVQNVMGEASFKEGEKSFKKGREELESEANVTEWSKVLRSGRSVFARVGSSPTVCIFPFSSSLFPSFLKSRTCFPFFMILYRAMT